MEEPSSKLGRKPSVTRFGLNTVSVTGINNKPSIEDRVSNLEQKLDNMTRVMNAGFNDMSRQIQNLTRVLAKVPSSPMAPKSNLYSLDASMMGKLTQFTEMHPPSRPLSPSTDLHLHLDKEKEKEKDKEVEQSEDGDIQTATEHDDSSADHAQQRRKSVVVGLGKSGRKFRHKTNLSMPSEHSYQITGTLLPESLIVTFTDLIFWAVTILELGYVSTSVGIGMWDEYPSTTIIILLSIASVYCALIIFLRTRVHTAQLLEADRTALFTAYKNSWLLFDVLQALPIDLLALLSSSPLPFRVLLIGRIFRAVRIPSLLQCSNPLVPTRLLQSSIRLLSYVIYGHVASATVFMLMNSSWMTQRGYSAAYTFLSSMYWAVQTSTSVGYGDILPGEYDWRGRLFSTFMMLMGVASYSYFISFLSVVVVRQDSVRSAIREKKEKLNSLMAFYGVPWEIQKQTFSLYPHLVESSNSDYLDIINVLPPFIQEQISYYVRLKLISRVPMFKGAEHAIIEELCHMLEEEIVPPKETIMRYGDVGKEMFFLVSGCVEVCGVHTDTWEEYHMALLREGAWFGEIAILWETPRTASIRTVTCCDLMVLSKDSVQSLVANHPNSTFATTLQEEASRRVEALGLPVLNLPVTAPPHDLLRPNWESGSTNSESTTNQ